jgi:co-chaperonin GroES (HSP10)
MKTRLKPVGPTLTVKITPDDEESVRSEFLDIPDSIANANDAAATKGVVVELSPHAYKEWFDGEPWVEVGDTVYIKRYSGINKVIDGVLYRVIEDKEVWSVLEEGDPDEELRKVQKDKAGR